MRQLISPRTAVRGVIRLPGDKSISHRYAMLGAIAHGETRIQNYSSGADCQSTLGALEALGVPVERRPGEIAIRGTGLHGLVAPAQTLDAGNSGSTIRMLSGILAGQPFTTRIAGDASLSRRPMARIMKPLGEMGAKIQARDGQYPPLEIHGGELRPIDYAMRVASAQVKTCVLFAGLYASGRTTVREPVQTRDHTERALHEFGAAVDVRPREVTVHGPARLEARELAVPGDLSSAAFFLAAALMAGEADLRIEGVGLNPTRSALIDFLVSIGGNVCVLDTTQTAGEPAGSLRVTTSRVRGGLIEGALTAALIDEIPVLAVLGAASDEGIEVRDASELRVKETDRIATVAGNLARMGIEVEVRPDGLRVPGRQRLRAAELDSFGDHRIAMAFSVAAVAADGPCSIDNAEAASVSFPEFYEILGRIAG